MTDFRVKLPGTVASDLIAAHEAGQTPQISSIELDWDDSLSNRPAGSDPVTVLIISFGVQVGATLTAEIVKKYLIDKSGRSDKSTEIEVQEKETEDEK
ncbi:hypothetical protein PhaeoP83_04103 (plasmid) [Phaeobacter inhibens]|uniref:Uncharacterized protein n=1 Tax=Phaeobacter inhibens TaxID=221822 RepID=A0ABM6RK56_9RHOB|nr:hypothetical protein [Phaeobacter inhibens]AUQ52321.1 hypothetical protein PhaeoP83_04103 [Phaeobacter inhibens]AUQ96926.1 hypothetical protein PhaeoP66_04200 [Phaeobacter inhibens]AUR22127.1 hypothetical protein PhaeoP80_04104 [Phaeobacter inhibens]